MATTVPASLNILHEAFARRMKQACDANDEIPPMNDGRLVWIQQKMGYEGHQISLQTAMRWYYGAAMPRQKKIVALAKVLGVSPSWLSLGRDDRPKIDTSNRRISTEGAVNALAGHMQMAGIPCAFPEKDDQRSDLVHFYSIIQGRQHPIHVTAGCTDKKDDRVIFQVPVKHAKAIILAVVPLNQKAIEVWHLPSDLIDSMGEKDSDMKTISAKLSGKELTLGKRHILALKDFSKALMI